MLFVGTSKGIKPSLHDLTDQPLSYPTSYAAMLFIQPSILLIIQPGYLQTITSVNQCSEILLRSMIARLKF
jgi:pSer/pThr/pTyr-binding forkhead associated (FHA) protein